MTSDATIIDGDDDETNPGLPDRQQISDDAARTVGGYSTDPQTIISPQECADDESAGTADCAASLDDTWIGPYRVVGELGQGGMGTVYLAEQQEPVHRRVALKIIKAGMDSAQVIARFEAERQALAVMSHPNIATVLDAGTTESGRPYFVMELVDGVPITEFCDQQSLAIRERLQLFLTICIAIQHAHQKGIIHRDLKPSNILVSMQDDQPAPRVIDFGLVKATGQSRSDEQQLTAQWQIVGTPEYMSPEQSQFDAVDIDTRSDVYSLGVILYELLTGSTPLKRDVVRQETITKTLERIREEEPDRPSSRIIETQYAHSLSDAHVITPRKFSMQMKGDLDWIILKALEKDRNRRYESASAFAADIRRHLDDEPVEARPPSTQYRLQKLIRRHRAAFTFAVTVASLLVIGTVVSSALAIWATREANVAETRRIAADEARVAAELSDRRSKRILDVVTDSFQSASPAEGAAFDMPASTALLLAYSQLDDRLGDDPIAKAALLHTLSGSFAELGQYELATRSGDEAIQIRQEHLGQLHADTLASMRSLTRVVLRSGEYTNGLEHAQRAMALTEQAMGAEHPDTLLAMNDLARAFRANGKSEQAISLLESTLDAQMKQLGELHPDTIASTADLARAYSSVGNMEKAIPLAQKALDLRRTVLGDQHPQTFFSTEDLATAYVQQGSFDEAIPLLQTTLAGRSKLLGDRHPHTLSLKYNLAWAYALQGKLDESIQLSEETLPQRIATLGKDHPHTQQSMHNLAWTYQEKGQLDKAIELFEEVTPRRRTRLGDEHPETLNSMDKLAWAYTCNGDLEKAIPLYRIVVPLSQSVLGKDSEHTLHSQNSLAWALYQTGNLDEAIALYEDVVPRRIAVLGKDHPHTQQSVNNLRTARAKKEHHGLATLQKDTQVRTTLEANQTEPVTSDGAADKEILHHEEVVTRRTATLGPDNAETLAALKDLSWAYARSGQRKKAIALQNRRKAIQKKLSAKQLFEKGEFGDAIIVGRQSEELYLKLSEDADTGAEFLLAAAGVAELQAKSHQSLEQTGEELASRERAISHCWQVTEKDPGDTVATTRLAAQIQVLRQRLSEVEVSDENTAIEKRIAALQQINVESPSTQPAPSDQR